MRNAILDLYQSFGYKRKCDVLEEAIGFMEQYNGRDYYDCIVLAMKELYPKKIEQIKEYLKTTNLK
jgi:hypothetical protein